MAAALVTLVDNDFLNQVVEHPRSQFLERGVLPCHLQEAADVDGLVVHLRKLLLKIQDFQAQVTLFLLIVRRKDFEPFIRQLIEDVILRETAQRPYPLPAGCAGRRRCTAPGRGMDRHPQHRRENRDLGLPNFL